MSKFELKAAVDYITESHAHRRQAAGARVTTYGPGLCGAGLDFNSQFKKVSSNTALGKFVKHCAVLTVLLSADLTVHC